MSRRADDADPLDTVDLLDRAVASLGAARDRTGQSPVECAALDEAQLDDAIDTVDRICQRLLTDIRRTGNARPDPQTS